MSGNIGKHMATLVPGIASAASERERVVGDIKLQTANMLHAFGRERRAMVKTLKSELAADRVSRSAEVLAIRNNASEMSNRFRQKHVLMRHSLRQSLVESREAVGASVASLFIDFSKERTDFFKAHHRMGKAQCAGLAKDRRDRSHAMAELMRSFTKAHRHMARVQWAGLAKGRRDRSQTVAELMQGFHVSRGKMVRELAKSLAKTTQVTKVQVSSSNWSPALLLKPSVVVDLAPQVETGLLVKQPAENIPAPITALRREAVKPLPKAAESLVKPWPSTPPRGEPVKVVSKNGPKKATPGKAVRHIVKPSKPKKK